MALTEGIHFYMNEEGRVVLTELFLRERGYCCGNGCKHCPYDYESVGEPRRSELLKKRRENDTTPS